MPEGLSDFFCLPAVRGRIVGEATNWDPSLQGLWEDPEVLPRLRKTIVDDSGNLDLTIVRRRQDSSGALERSQP